MSAHTSGDAKKKPSGLIVGCLIVGIFLTVAIGLRKISDMADSKESAEASSSGNRASGIPGNRVRAALVEPYVRVPLKAPARTGDWSRVVNVPSGYRPLFCEADESLACTSTETDMAKVNFVFDCRDLRGNASIRTEEGDLIACRVRAKGDEALNLAVWLEPY